MRKKNSYLLKLIMKWNTTEGLTRTSEKWRNYREEFGNLDLNRTQKT
jgi:hypothetical protein